MIIRAQKNTSKYNKNVKQCGRVRRTTKKNWWVTRKTNAAATDLRASKCGIAKNNNWVSGRFGTRNSKHCAYGQSAVRWRKAGGSRRPNIMQYIHTYIHTPTHTCMYACTYLNMYMFVMYITTLSFICIYTPLSGF